MPIYEVVSQGDNPFLVMDFVEGRNLREFIKIRKKFEPAEATRLMIDVAAGLSYAFERGICHRDLKMSNILVSSRGQAKLVDFGLAGGEATDDDPEAANPRTIDYAGLERATGVRKDDPRSDIYFLGCIYYHLLTGVPPIAETRDRTQRLSQTPFPERDADPGLSIPRCRGRSWRSSTRRWSSVPSQRYQIARRNARRPESRPRRKRADPRRRRPTAGAASRRRGSAAQRSLMVVESKSSCRTSFASGSRAAAIACSSRRIRSGPWRGSADDAKAADCVMFSPGDLGSGARSLQPLRRRRGDQADSGGAAVGREAARVGNARPSSDKHRVVIDAGQAARAARSAGQAAGRPEKGAVPQSVRSGGPADGPTTGARRYRLGS